MPASPRPSTRTGTCTPERWTATPTGSTRRTRTVLRPKCGQTTVPMGQLRRENHSDLGIRWRARRDSNPNLLIRRLRQVVQDRLLRSVCWTDIPQPSTRDRRCPVAWQQYWQQSPPNGTDSRPSAVQAGQIPRVVGGRASMAGTRGALILLTVRTSPGTFQLGHHQDGLARSSPQPDCCQTSGRTRSVRAVFACT